MSTKELKFPVIDKERHVIADEAEGKLILTSLRSATLVINHADSIYGAFEFQDAIICIHNSNQTFIGKVNSWACLDEDNAISFEFKMIYRKNIPLYHPICIPLIVLFTGMFDPHKYKIRHNFINGIITENTINDNGFYTRNAYIPSYHY